MGADKTIVNTMTGEIFLPIRLYYKVHCKSGVETNFREIRCMDFDPANDRWTWLYDDEAKKLKFEKPYSSIPVERRPIILGSFYSRVDSQMYLDIGSIDRALKAIDFFSKYIKPFVAEVEFFSIYNKITSTQAEHPGPCFDKLFADLRPDLVDQRIDEKIARDTEMMKSGRFLEVINDRTFNLTEVHRVENTKAGIEHLSTMLSIREAVAIARWDNKPDYCMNDFIKDAMFRDSGEQVQ